MDSIDLDSMKGRSDRPQNFTGSQTLAKSPLTGECPGKGRCHCDDPGANGEEKFQDQPPDSQKVNDANQKQHQLPCSHQRTENTKINREILPTAGLHFL